MTKPENQSFDSRSQTRFLSYRIARLHQALSAQAVAALEEAGGLTIGQWRVLSILISGPASTSKEVVQQTSLDPAFVSRTLKSLESEGLVTTERPGFDRRTLLITVTPAGHSVHNETLPLMQIRQRHLLEALTEEEQNSLLEMISKLDVAAHWRGFKKD